MSTLKNVRMSKAFSKASHLQPTSLASSTTIINKANVAGEKKDNHQRGGKKVCKPRANASEFGIYAFATATLSLLMARRMILSDL